MFLKTTALFLETTPMFSETMSLFSFCKRVRKILVLKLAEKIFVLG